jgi:DNA-directed RNA polymerase subunit M/transcription elongation factor TFIIS
LFCKCGAILDPADAKDGYIKCSYCQYSNPITNAAVTAPRQSINTVQKTAIEGGTSPKGAIGEVICHAVERETEVSGWLGPLSGSKKKKTLHCGRCDCELQGCRVVRTEIGRARICPKCSAMNEI